MKRFLFLFSFLWCFCADAQFAPQSGILGTTALHKTNTSIKGWATGCEIFRGYRNISDKSMGLTIAGDHSAAIGLADGEIVSLGDSGVAVLSFSQPLYNGFGADFAVFENGFQNPTNLEESYMELAFVEVSSDGKNYFRFPATSNTNSAVQIEGVGQYMNARYVHNLAGKYIGQFGTPFDLEDLKGIEGLDINRIISIRIVDVVGSIAQYGTKDQNGQAINDPYPTPFPTGGFDLDALAAINIRSSSLPEIGSSTFSIYPNPAIDRVQVHLENNPTNDLVIVISDLMGKTVLQQKAILDNEMNIQFLKSGIYLLSIKDNFGIKCIGKFSKI
jgi:hypothetical protein